MRNGKQKISSTAQLYTNSYTEIHRRAQFRNVPSEAILTITNPFSRCTTYINIEKEIAEIELPNDSFSEHEDSLMKQVFESRLESSLEEVINKLKEDKSVESLIKLNSLLVQELKGIKEQMKCIRSMKEKESSNKVNYYNTI